MNVNTEVSTSAAELFAAYDIPDGSLDERWEALFQRAPELFDGCDAGTISVPCEWEFLVFMYAARHGQLEPLVLDGERFEVADRAVRIMSQLMPAGAKATPVDMFTWSSPSMMDELTRNDIIGFSTAGEPLMRSAVAIAPEVVADRSPEFLAQLIAHEVQHASGAVASEPKVGFFRTEHLSVALEEAAVTFSALVVYTQLLHGGLPSVADLVEVFHDADELFQVLEVCVELGPTLASPVALAQRLNELSVFALRVGDSRELVGRLNAAAGSDRSLGEWTERFACASRPTDRRAGVTG